MTRTILVIVIAVVTGLSVSAPAGATTDTQRREIRFQRVARDRWTDREVRMTIRAAVHRWHVAGGVPKAMSVARCESGFEARAYNPSSGAAGVFQQLARYWRGRQNRYDSHRWHLGESVFNARANVIVSIRQAHQAGWGAWSCA